MGQPFPVPCLTWKPPRRCDGASAGAGSRSVAVSESMERPPGSDVRVAAVDVLAGWRASALRHTTYLEQGCSDNRDPPSAWRGRSRTRYSQGSEWSSSKVRNSKTFSIAILLLGALFAVAEGAVEEETVEGPAGVPHRGRFDHPPWHHRVRRRRAEPGRRGRSGGVRDRAFDPGWHARSDPRDLDTDAQLGGRRSWSTWRRAARRRRRPGSFC